MSEEKLWLVAHSRFREVFQTWCTPYVPCKKEVDLPGWEIEILTEPPLWFVQKKLEGVVGSTNFPSYPQYLGWIKKD